MYLRRTTRKKDGKVHRYWRLVRSVRVGRRVIQQTVAHLGELDDRGRLAARAFARRLIGTPEQAGLFDDGCRDVAVPVRLNLNPAVEGRQLWIGEGELNLCVPAQAGCNRRGGSSWRPLRYLTRARLRIRHQRSRSVNCSAVARSSAKKAAMRVSARRARWRWP